MHGVWAAISTGPSHRGGRDGGYSLAGLAVLCVFPSRPPFPLTAPPAVSAEMLAALLVLGGMGSAAVRFLSTRLTPGMREEGKSPKDILKEEPSKLMRK